jgi:hypothetical protein
MFSQNYCRVVHRLEGYEILEFVRACDSSLSQKSVYVTTLKRVVKAE